MGGSQDSLPDQSVSDDDGSGELPEVRPEPVLMARAARRRFWQHSGLFA